MRSPGFFQFTAAEGASRPPVAWVRVTRRATSSSGGTWAVMRRRHGQLVEIVLWFPECLEQPVEARVDVDVPGFPRPSV